MDIRSDGRDVRFRSGTTLEDNIFLIIIDDINTLTPERSQLKFLVRANYPGVASMLALMGLNPTGIELCISIRPLNEIERRKVSLKFHETFMLDDRSYHHLIGAS